MCSQYAFEQTGCSFDFALVDNGRSLFTVKDAHGIKLVRSGRFRLNSEGFLVTPNGAHLLGHNGPIKATGSRFEVDDSGVVSIDGKQVDRILISIFEQAPKITIREGTVVYSGSTTVRVSADCLVKQGFLEKSASIKYFKL